MGFEKFYYKNKPYKVNNHCKAKIDGKWINCVVYECLYENPDGQVWIRTGEEFYKLFQLRLPEIPKTSK